MSQKVVIITPIKNLIQNERADFFQKLCQSVQSQTWTEIEHLLLADVSEDGTDALIEEYAKAHSNVVIHHAVTKNKWAAMNTALELADGDYVLFLKDDEFLTNADSVETMVNTLEQNDADFTYGDCWRQPKVGNHFAGKVVLGCFFRFPFIPLCTILCKLSVAKDVSCFDDNYDLTGDYAYMLQLCFSGKKGVALPVGLSTECLHYNSTDEAHAHYFASQKEMIEQVKNVFSGVDSMTDAQFEHAVITGQVPYSFVQKALIGVHPFFTDEIDRQVNEYVHRYDDFKEYAKQGIDTIYIPLLGIGDALMFAPIARKLYEQTGKKILVGHKNKEIFENNPYVIATDVMYDSPDHLLLEDIEYFKKNNFSIVFATMWNSHAVHAVDGKKFIFSYPKHHMIAEVAARCGVDDTMELKPEIYLTQEEKAFGRIFPKDRKQIAIMSSAMVPRKQYPYFQQIVDALKDEYDFVQIGAPEDKLLNGVKENLVGKLKLRQTAGVLYNSDLFVGELGGLMHLARAVDCPAVIAFSSSEPDKVTRYICNAEIKPKRVCKLSQKGKFDKGCSPCMNKHPYCCIQTVPVEKMIKAIRKQIKLGRHEMPVEVVRVKPVPFKNSINEFLRRYNYVFNLDNL